MLYREPMWLKFLPPRRPDPPQRIVSVLYREPMWLKWLVIARNDARRAVSVLYREPMWLKCAWARGCARVGACFSALP